MNIPRLFGNWECSSTLFNVTTVDDTALVGDGEAFDDGCVLGDCPQNFHFDEQN